MMSLTVRRAVPAAAVLALAMFGAACAKKVAAAKPQPPTATPPPANVDQPKAVAVATRPAPVEQVKTATAKQNPTMTTDERKVLNEQLAKLEDALFDYDKSTIRADAAQVLGSNVAVIRSTLARFPGEKITIEGHADQRGSDEYNMALGEQRALASKEFLTNMGVSATQLTTITYGKDRPQCSETTEDCYQRNRRAHLVSRAQ